VADARAAAGLQVLGVEEQLGVLRGGRVWCAVVAMPVQRGPLTSQTPPARAITKLRSRRQAAVE
jgi:hypothetical protein